MKHKLESRLLGEISITSEMQDDDTTLRTESIEELNALMKGKEESEKVGLKLDIQNPVPSLHGKYMGKQWK